MEPVSLSTFGDDLASIVAKIPAPIEARIAAGNALVAASGPHGVPIGTAAPTFILPNAAGEMVDLATRLERGPVVLTFYRGDWCPFCNLQLRALRDVATVLSDLGATIVAISPQNPDHGEALSESLLLGFDVLSDVDQAVIGAYNLLYEIDEGTRDLLENVFHNDISTHNADGTWRLPIPATFILDEHGVVCDAYVNADYRTRMDPTDIVNAVRQIAASPTAGLESQKRSGS